MTRASPLIGLVGAVLLGTGCDITHVPAGGSHRDFSVGTHVVMLGTGTPNADPDRSGPGVAVIVDGVPYMVDSGPGVVRRAAAGYQAGIGPLVASNLKHLLLTHLHSDHTVGLPDVIFTPWVLGRDEPLELFGPVGSQQMVTHLLAAYQEDVRVRLEGLEPANEFGYRVNVHEITEPGTVYQDSSVRITAFAVHHGSWRQAFGFKFETRDRVVVISGDTAPTDAIVEQCNGCDVLVHEVYSQAGFERREPLWQEYHATFHTSSFELAEIATRARPKLLVLYHQLFWGTSEAELLREIRSRYDGEVVSARDLDVF